VTPTDPFTPPDLSAPLDLAERLRDMPPGAAAKGMFFQPMIDAARAVAGRAPGRERYLSFKDYPMDEFMTVMAGCAELAFPRVPPRDGIRRLALNAYLKFEESTIGRVVTSVAGRNFHAALRLVPRMYSITTTPGHGRAEMGAIEERRAEVQLRGFWDFPDAWHVGVFEGGMRVFGKTGDVRVRVHSRCDVDLELRWK
jgi:uncharacterized protein (TIGR02265 family)